MSRAVLSSECERKLGPNEEHGGNSEATRAVVSAGATVHPGASAQVCARVSTEQPVSHRDALRQGDVQSRSNAQESTPSASGASRETGVQAVQRESRIARATKSVGNSVSNAMEQRAKNSCPPSLEATIAASVTVCEEEEEPEWVLELSAAVGGVGVMERSSEEASSCKGWM